MQDQYIDDGVVCTEVADGFLTAYEFRMMMRRLIPLVNAVPEVEQMIKV
jgi:hypothetical protein